jgi:hypothetical protein
MERALDIFSGDTRVSELKVNSKGKAIKVPHTMNKASGKPSSALKAFSDTNYSEVTRGYMKSINRLRESVIRDVWERTKDIAAKRHGAPTALDSEDSDDERALIYNDWYYRFIVHYYSLTDDFVESFTTTRCRIVY